MRKFTKTQKEVKIDFIDKLFLKIFSYRKPISNRFRRLEGVHPSRRGPSLFPLSGAGREQLTG
jgi:hypothetical protein